MDPSSLFTTIVEQASASSSSARIVSVSAVVLWSAVFVAAWRRRQHYTLALLVGTLFCLVSENVAIQLGKYHYAAFPLALPGVELRPVFTRLEAWGVFPRLVDCPGQAFSLRVPLEIAMLEGTLLYAVFRLTNLLSPPTACAARNAKSVLAWARAQAPNAMLNGFLAVSLDSILDPVASGTMTCDGSGSNFTGIALWTWHTTSYYGGHWFGVPLANYTAWFGALVAFTVAVRIQKDGISVNGSRIERGRNAAWATVRGVGGLALLLFLVKLPLDQVMYEGLGVVETPTPAWWQFLIAGVFLAAGVYGTWRVARGERTAHPIEWSTLAPVIFVFSYVLVGLVRDGLYRRSMWLVPLWIAATAVAAVHASSPFWPRRSPRAQKTPDGVAAGV